MQQLIWLVAIAGALVAFAFAIGALIATIRKKSLAIGAFAVALIASLLILAFGVRHNIVLMVGDIVAYVIEIRILKATTRNNDHASEIVRLSATHMALLAGTVHPFA